ncbi:MAG: U32 family peptidase [Defluviitaleaceae bacterium]|nr:U32 family peptidase [Defluviitaleaceae bacterium]
MKTKLELLAPAGSPETLRAAIKAGADAVYLGAAKFSARANAKNFHGDALAEAIAYARQHGAAVHLAVNTLMTDRELDVAIQVVSHTNHLGATAFIVQDLGLGARIRKMFPQAVLHASTQMTAKTLADVQALGRLGYTRVVMARELSAVQLREIAAGTDVELEVFVHGALCSSESGQCLMSAFLGGAAGGRSANRGGCAQPCRLPYTAGSIKTRKPFPPAQSNNPSAAPLLSLKDLCLIDHVGTLAQMGIASLKIEGRMKGEEYVRTVVGAYRKVLDGGVLSSKERERLFAVFNRGGYTAGYFDGHSAGMYMDALSNPYGGGRK